MDYRILGPLEVRDGSRRLALAGGRQRALLAILLLHRNEIVTADRLIDELWGESPPAGARKTLRAYVSKLRRAMVTNGATPAVDQGSEREQGDGVLMTRGHGYVLEITPGNLDLDRFIGAAERGRDALATGRPEDAARLLREALSLWRGPPLTEFTYEPFAQPAIARIEELHLSAVEEVRDHVDPAHARRGKPLEPGSRDVIDRIPASCEGVAHHRRRVTSHPALRSSAPTACRTSSSRYSSGFPDLDEESSYPASMTSVTARKPGPRS